MTQGYLNLKGVVMCWHSNAYFSLFSSLFFFDFHRTNFSRFHRTSHLVSILLALLFSLLFLEIGDTGARLSGKRQSGRHCRAMSCGVVARGRLAGLSGREQGRTGSVVLVPKARVGDRGPCA